jgi:methyl-accepting chemotaxis protein
LLERTPNVATTALTLQPQSTVANPSARRRGVGLFTQILGGLVALVLVAVGGGLLARSALDRAEADVHELEHQVEESNLLATLYGVASVRSGELARYIATEVPEEMAALEARFAETTGDCAEHADELLALPGISASVGTGVEALKEGCTELDAVTAELVTATQNGTDGVSDTLFADDGKGTAVLAALATDFSEASGVLHHEAQETQATAESDARSSHRTNTFVIVATLLLGVAVAGWTVRSLRRSAKRVDQAAAELVTSVVTLGSATAVAAESAEAAAREASTASAAAEEVSVTIAAVAAASEELGASIHSIAASATQAAGVAAEASATVGATNATVAKLGQSSSEIGAVIDAITTIAEQTNLLALNATIEAARAGEAGKGFAVVANEVKELAKQTAQATGDIRARIEAIQGDSTEVVEALARISSVIDEVNDLQSTIASAVEEQAATTQEISRNVAGASTGAEEIARSLTTLASSSATATEQSNVVAVSTTQLDEVSGELALATAPLRF